jgi:putative DNA primase/helicase
MMRVPGELFHHKQWVLWKRVAIGDRIAKVPISPWSGKRAACDEPQTGSSYRHARFMQERWACEGLGFVFTAEDPFCGIDLDRCRNEEDSIEPWAQQILERLASYTEWSPSGKGLHILVRASLPEECRHRAGRFECYDRGCYFTMTGDHLAGSPFEIAGIGRASAPIPTSAGGFDPTHSRAARR